MMTDVVKFSLTHLPGEIAGLVVKAEMYPYPLGGHAVRLWLRNGYGLSMINHPQSYRSEGTVEVAVVRQTGEDVGEGIPCDLDYSTPVTDDVLGYQTLPDVVRHIKTLSTLPNRYLAMR